MGQQMHARQDMDSQLERQLDEGEELLWSGHPITGSKNNSPQRTASIILSIIYGIIGIVLLFIAFMMLISHSSDGDLIGMQILVMIGGIFFLLAILAGIFIAVNKWSPQNTLYAITNQRVIIIHKDRATTTISYGRADLGAITCIEKPDGSGDLIFSGANPQHGYTAYSSGPYGAGNSGSSIYNKQAAGKFIGIPGVRETEQLLRKTFK